MGMCKIVFLLNDLVSSHKFQGIRCCYLILIQQIKLIFYHFFM